MSNASSLSWSGIGKAIVFIALGCLIWHFWTGTELKPYRVSETPAEEVAQLARDQRALRAALTDYNEVRAHAGEWPTMQVVRSNAPIWIADGEWLWVEPSIVGVATSDTSVKRPVLEVKVGNETKTCFPSPDTKFFGLREVKGGEPTKIQHWNQTQPILVNTSVRVYLPNCPTAFMPAAQRLSNGTFTSEEWWVSSADVRSKPVHPLAQWCVNTSQGSLELDGKREIIARYTTYLAPGARTQPLIYQAPPWAPGEEKVWTHHWAVRSIKEVTFKYTINGVSYVSPYGERQLVENNQLILGGNFHLVVELAEDCELPAGAAVEFVYYRERRV